MRAFDCVVRLGVALADMAIAPVLASGDILAAELPIWRNVESSLQHRVVELHYFQPFENDLQALLTRNEVFYYRANRNDLYPC